eukprot:285068-Pyramimonas_sp.AAC.2
MGRRRHASCAIGVLGGAPYGATKHVRDVPKLGGGTMRPVPLGPSVPKWSGGAMRAAPLGA